MIKVLGGYVSYLALGFEKMSRGSLKNTVSIIKCLRHTIFMITLCFIIIALMH
jgi:hypothetical protein